MPGFFEKHTARGAGESSIRKVAVREIRFPDAGFEIQEKGLY